MAKLSIALICHNEALNLPAWLEAVERLADEIVAVDSGSSDDTVEILRAAGAKVEHREWSGYTDQRNHAADLCSGDWILFLDADEVIDLELAASLVRLKTRPFPKEAGFELSYQVHFFGHFMRFGGYYPERHLRLYRAGMGRWEEREVHERLKVDGPVGRLKPGTVRHYSYRDVGEYLLRTEVYAEQAARHMFLSGRRSGPLRAWGHAFWTFFSRYVLRLGLFDGWAGYLAARMEATYTLAKYARLIDMGGADR